ncbi:MAG: hypothetical protein ACXVZW_02950 [Gaiellaceae bacterium]
MLAAGLLAAASLAATANGRSPRQPGPPKPPSAPGVSFAQYKVSGYGVYHRTTYWDYKAAPCQPATPVGKGGGYEGLERYDGTLRWETVKPGLATITRYAGARPGMELGVARGALEPGIIATVSITYTHTGELTNVKCNADGSEERQSVPQDIECGSHTYKSGYLALPVWPNAGSKPGEHFGFGIRRLPAIEKKVQKDWSFCGPAVFEYQDQEFVNGALPFSSLPKHLHGKVSAIARGGETVIDSTEMQGAIAGSSVHQYDAYHATDYITLVRAG